MSEKEILFEALLSWEVYEGVKKLAIKKDQAMNRVIEEILYNFINSEEANNIVEDITPLMDRFLQIIKNYCARYPDGMPHNELSRRTVRWARSGDRTRLIAALIEKGKVRAVPVSFPNGQTGIIYFA